MSDITERKKVEKSLLESEEKYRALMDNAGDAIILMDMQGNLLEINRKTVSLFGRMNEEVFNVHFSSFIPKNELKRTIAAFDDLIRDGSVVINDLNLIKKDGTTIPVDMTGTIIQYAGKKVAQAIFRDITERKKAQEALKDSEEKYRTIIENSNDMIWTADLSGHFQFCNRHTEEISGYRLEEMRNKDFSPLITKEELPKLMEIFSRVLKGQPQQYEATIKKRDGTALLLSINTAPLYSNGTMIGTVSFGRDITELKKAEQEHLENERLEKADKAKSEFLANMSHELRTPLNASMGFTELLQLGMAGKLNEKQKNYLDIIYASNQLLLDLINDILDLSKVEAGKIELLTEKMSVPETIKETLSLIKEKAMKHNVLLETELNPELEFIEADKQRFKQILYNLLSNALKFSKEEGGTITITATKEGNMAKVSVSDTGIGIKEENVGRLFHKFEQLESGICQKYGGTGLGLSITKQLVELHGGKIWAQSKYGEGSTFTLTLPIEAKKRG